MPGGLARGDFIRLRYIGRRRPAELIAAALVTERLGLAPIAFMELDDGVGRTERHDNCIFALGSRRPFDGLAGTLRRNPDRRMRRLNAARPGVDVAEVEMVALEGERPRLGPGPDDQVVGLVEALMR